MIHRSRFEISPNQPLKNSGRVVREKLDDPDIYPHDRDAAVAKAREAFDSWRERGQPGQSATRAVWRYTVPSNVDVVEFKTATPAGEE